MSRVLLILLLAAVVAFLVAIRLHNSERARAAREAALPRFDGSPLATPPGASPSPGTPASGPAAEGRRRGLWLLAADEAARGAKAVEPHPWAEYIRKRNATRAAWKNTKLDVHFNHARLKELPDYFAPAGLTLKIDPALLAGDDEIEHEYVFEFQQKSAEEILLTSTSCDLVWLTVGVDGALWLVPRVERAACEPEFIREVQAWSSVARTILVPPDFYGYTTPKPEFSAKLAEKHAVQIVRQPLQAAMDIVIKTWGITVTARLLEIDEEHPAPATLPVSVVGDEVTLEEALKEIFEAQELVAVPRRNTIEILGKDAWAAEVVRSAARKETAQAVASEVEALRNRVVRLDGKPLSAGDLAAAVASQLGLHLKLDPLLDDVAARWEAVDAELKVGEVLDAIAAGAKCRCELHPDAWPRSEERSAGWTLWVVTEIAVVK